MITLISMFRTSQRRHHCMWQFTMAMKIWFAFSLKEMISIWIIGMSSRQRLFI
ncbi:hypothetical protein BDV06DRAFT_198484 [Aspergillus oleicola]